MQQQKHIRSKIIHLLTCSAIVIAALACSTAEQPGTVDPVCGLASPLVFYGDTATFVVSDYILEPARLDTFITHPEISVITREDRFLLVRRSGLPVLSSVALVTTSNDTFHIPVQNRRQVRISITFDPGDKPIERVQVRGEMNFWNAQASSMKKTDGIWSEEFMLSPGEYQYLLVMDGKEQTDPANPLRIDNNMGGLNSLLRVGSYRQEELPFIRATSLAADTLYIVSTQRLTEATAFLQNREIPVILEAKSMKIPVPGNLAPDGRGWLRVYAAADGALSNDMLLPLEAGRVVMDPEQLSRFDRQTLIMYFMMIDRFRNGNTSNDEPVNDPEILPEANYYGGDLQGVFQTMQDGYFSDLGINTIWLSPITQNPRTAYGLYPDPHTRFSGYHGYWPVSSARIDDRFGTDADLHRIVAAAHDRDQNVLLDYVANHVHEEHPVYKHHPEWATSLYLPDGTLNTEKWDEHRLTTWFDTFLPTLDLTRPEVVEPMTDSAIYWIKEFGIDGFRHDATKHIDELFWRQLTLKLKHMTGCDTMVYQIGETYGSPELISSYVNSGMLDGQFDFNLYDNAIAVFAREEESFIRLKNALTQSLQYYGYHNLMGNITGNQDRPRFISLAGGALRFDEDAKYAGWTREIGVGDLSGYDKLMLLHAFNMTIPGIPVIYYGDEYGMPGGNDPDNRRQMKFGGLNANEETVRQTVRKLAVLRSASMPLLYGGLKFLYADDQVLVYCRYYLDKSAVVFMNKSAGERNITIDKAVLQGGIPSAVFHPDRFSLAGDSLRVTLPAYGFEIINN